MSKNLKILFHVPKVHSYRAPALYSLAKLVKILPIADDFDYTFLNKRDIRNISKLNNTIKGLSFLKKNNKFKIISKAIFMQYDVLFCSLDIKRYDLLLSGIICKLRGKVFIFHSHCLWKQNKNKLRLESLIKIGLNYFWFKISSGVISYGDKSRRYFYLNQKVKILENRFENLPLENTKTIKPVKRLLAIKPIKVLFIGRILTKESINLLKEVHFLLKNKYNIFIEFNIISREVITQNKQIFRNHGEIRNYKKIQKISQSCLFGIHPSNCGLSVIHYMSLGIIPVVHDKFYLHGPEVINNCTEKNTIFYRQMDSADCAYKFKKIILDPKTYNKIRKESIKRSRDIHSKPLSRELYEHILSINNQSKNKKKV